MCEKTNYICFIGYWSGEEKRRSIQWYVWLNRLACTMIQVEEQTRCLQIGSSAFSLPILVATCLEWEILNSLPVTSRRDLSISIDFTENRTWTQQTAFTSWKQIALKRPLCRRRNRSLETSFSPMQSNLKSDLSIFLNYLSASNLHNPMALLVKSMGGFYFKSILFYLF